LNHQFFAIGFHQFGKNKSALIFAGINPAEGIYPNPANTKARFQHRMENSEKVIISITSIEGKTIDKYVENANKGINTKEIKVSRYENGIYFITLDTKSAHKTYKLIINK